MSDKVDCPGCGHEQVPDKDKHCEKCGCPGFLFFYPEVHKRRVDK